MYARVRPDAARRVADGMKLHRYVLRLDGAPYTVVTPRPGTEARFSTNRYHDTWHVLSDLHGAHLTSLRARAARELRRRLPLARPQGSVRWHTPGLGPALEAWFRERDGAPGAGRIPWVRPRGFREQVDRVGGLLVLAATPPALREWAVSVSQLGAYLADGMDYTALAWPSGDGEVQVFTDYRRRVADARVARREVLAELAQAVPPSDLEPLVWHRGSQVRQHRG